MIFTLSEQNPNILKEILQPYNSLGSMFIESGYYELLRYYENKENKDSIDYYYSILINSLARRGEHQEGAKLFDDWMSKNSNPNAEEIDLWDYYFYVDFALFYNTNLEKALEYAVILEKNQPVVDYKMLLAKVLYLNNKNKEAIDKLNEIIPMVEDAELKQKIDKLILDYKN